MIRILILVLMLMPAHASAQVVLRGQGYAVDADTIDVGGERVRLYGIDAPETAQSCRDERGRRWWCGTSATHRLTQMLEEGPVSCRGSTRDDYGRLLATCSTERGEINRRLVAEGLAWAFVRYSQTYASTEAQARRLRAGVFGADNQPPWEFRAQRWSRAAAANASPGDCPIKGNIARGGERIYHLPWQRDYGRVKIDEPKGERWFCDERQALAAGWRKAAR